jgi:hypothetical protein
MSPTKEDIMKRYYVHYEDVAFGEGVGWTEKIMKMIMPVEAKSEVQAIARCKLARPGSFGHCVKPRETA